MICVRAAVGSGRARPVRPTPYYHPRQVWGWPDRYDAASTRRYPASAEKDSRSSLARRNEAGVLVILPALFIDLEDAVTNVIFTVRDAHH